MSAVAKIENNNIFYKQVPPLKIKKGKMNRQIWMGKKPSAFYNA